MTPLFVYAFALYRARIISLRIPCYPRNSIARFSVILPATMMNSQSYNMLLQVTAGLSQLSQAAADIPKPPHFPPPLHTAGRPSLPATSSTPTCHQVTATHPTLSHFLLRRSTTPSNTTTTKISHTGVQTDTQSISVAASQTTPRPQAKIPPSTPFNMKVPVGMTGMLTPNVSLWTSR